MSVEFINLPIYLLVFVRLSATFLFNPIFSRRNVPMMVKMGFIFMLTILVAPSIKYSTIQPDDLTFILLIFKEVLVGLVFGYIVQIFQMMLFFVGELLDFQFGLSMSKIFDPVSNIQVSAIGNYFQIIFIVLFFTTNAHLIFIKIIVTSFEYLNVFSFVDIVKIAPYMIDLFLNVFMIIIKLAIPFIIAEFALEVAMGILMRLIPQIHIFVINIQVKIIVGIVLLLLFVGPVSNFLDQYIGTMINKCQEVIVEVFV